jgi:hypothetical protein
MKKIILIVLIAMSCNCIYSQPIPPPGGGVPGSGHGLGGNQGGNGAPIDGGVSILLGLGAIYGVRKIYKFNKQNVELK